ncbi:MAG TPA: fatty acid desaturase [Puia sp.]|jgi:stearoyl-CoA desaturase (delta-9 desaturase)|nr:fatty acid desaturase [Puia sp.]
MVKGSFIDNLLHAPSYGWQDPNGVLVIPTSRQLWSEAFARINIFRSRKNWISFVSFMTLVAMLPFLFLFLFKYFSWYLMIAVVIYSMIIMGTHGTIWFHRYCTHKSYGFSRRIWRIITQNLVIKTLPEEIYVVSHHVHHCKSDEPGDPYNSKAGFWYCMLAEYNHQRVSPHLNEEEYKKAVHFMQHTGVKVNSYKQYRKWGSLTSPVYALFMWAVNWAFWFSVFFLIGGPALACAIFSAAMLWFTFIRAFNYTGHGGGKGKHKEGLDFDRSNLSINQTRPGLLAGEWHNNHHLYPGSARCGFLPGQLDLAWVYIYTLHKLRMISWYKDSKREFLKKYGSIALQPVAARPIKE